MAIPAISYEKTGCYRLLNLLENKVITKEFVFVGRWPLKMTCKSTISIGGRPFFWGQEPPAMATWSTSIDQLFICVATSFNSSSYFSKAYQDQFGICPSDNRRVWPDTRTLPE